MIGDFMKVHELSGMRVVVQKLGINGLGITISDGIDSIHKGLEYRLESDRDIAFDAWTEEISQTFAIGHSKIWEVERWLS